MPGSCCRDAYGEFFDERLARRDARRYRARGARGVTLRLVRLLVAHGIEGARVLEIGGGVGALTIELLEWGASQGTIVEISPGYDRPAAELAEERDLDERIERRIGDIVDEPELAESADVVVLNRVVCCYPDEDKLLGRAADKARRLLAFSYPPDLAVARVAVALANLWPRLRGSDFRAYVHAEDRMLQLVEGRGFRLLARERAGVWRVAVLERV